jgi:hypothetical protein
MYRTMLSTHSRSVRRQLLANSSYSSRKSSSFLRAGKQQLGLLLQLGKEKSTELPLAVGSRYKCEIGEFDPRESVDKDKIRYEEGMSWGRGSGRDAGKERGVRGGTRERGRVGGRWAYCCNGRRRRSGFVGGEAGRIAHGSARSKSAHGGAARKEGGADLCTVAQRTRAGNGSARRRGTREGTQTKGGYFYWVVTR